MIATGVAGRCPAGVSQSRPMTEPRRRSVVLDVTFVVAVTVVSLWAINGVVEVLESRGVVQTHQPDDAVIFVEDDLFRVESAPQYVTTDYATETGVVPGRFGVDKGSGWRLFLMGGSFVMGSPYTHQGHGVEMPGGIATWLREDLARWGSAHPIEVVNMGVGGQNSFRVASMVDPVLAHAPDAVVVATCNNEGALPPSMVRQQLHRLGGYRLLAKYLAPTAEPQERSYYTPQDADSVELARGYRDNIRRMIAAAEEAGVPLLLATLPINRLYQGESESRPLTLTDDYVSTRSGCVNDGLYLREKGDLLGALEVFEGCEDIADALRWRGLTLYELRRFEEARPLLEQSIELQPRNRCRPSFNGIVREEAAASANTTLVDLDEAALEVAKPPVLPGEELFLDYCHLNWQGYAQAADAVLTALEQRGLLPADATRPDEPLDLETRGRRLGLDRVWFVDE
jgi:tetratricopeptide (TPR) repeat protein